MGMLISVSSVLGYATISYVLNKTIDTNVTVGETVKYTDGLLIELNNYEPYTLTYFELEETDTSKHYITYTYNYTVLVDNTNIEVSSLSDDIIVSELTYTESTISITFSLNQEKVFNNGDIINIEFYFEAIEESLGEFTTSNPININTASDTELASIGFTAPEIAEIRNSVEFTDIYHMNQMIYVYNLLLRYEDYANKGIIVFN